MFELQASQWIYFDKSLPIGYECIKNSQKTTILVKSRRIISKKNPFSRCIKAQRTTDTENTKSTLNTVYI